MLSEAECERARQARDPRFDGRFFIAVRTTGVYCRPVCPVRIPMAKNVTFFPSAAAAAGAGFRPCLRCRPESAPGSAAWRGSEVTVARALRLIDEGALDGAGNGVPQLAERLGIGERHLSRLFNEHVGASPAAVAQTRRLHFAKKLLDETDLSMTDVALSAGFGSVRRFNATVQQTYGRSPRELRSKRRKPRDGITLRLAYRPPHDLGQLFRFFAGHAIAGVEEVSDTRYRRTARIGDSIGVVELRATEAGHLELIVDARDASTLMTLVARARALFDLDANPEAVAAHLRRDSRTAHLVSAHGAPRVPGGWDAFELIVRTILGQGVSVAAARTLGERLAHEHGVPVDDASSLTRLFPSPQALQHADLTTIGVTRVRASAIRTLARAVVERTIDLGEASCLEGLRSFRGIGPWTIAYVALRAFGEPDAFPAHDLVLQRVLGAKTPGDANRAAERWRPWRGYAAMLLWQEAS